MSVGELSEPNRETLAAICSRICPDGDDGFGAVSAGVRNYIERQLASEWGHGGRMYRQGPFGNAQDGGHGWQSPMTPAQAYLYGLEAFNAAAAAEHGVRFERLAPSAQDALLAKLESDSISTFTEISGAQFFELVRQSVIEGLFADPAYGGNHLQSGWHWLGYSAHTKVNP